MTPEMGVAGYTDAEADARVAIHAALTATHGVAGAIADVADIATHAAIAAAHHTKYTDAEADARVNVQVAIHAALPTVHQDAPALIATHAANYGLHTKVVRKTADETVNNDTTLQNDDHLLLAVAANEVWYLEFWIRYSSPSATPDWKFAITVPAAGALQLITSGIIGSLTATQMPPVIAQATAEPQIVVTQPCISLIKALYIGGANAGNIQLQWAQQTATVEDTKVLANSCLIAHKIA